MKNLNHDTSVSFTNENHAFSSFMDKEKKQIFNLVGNLHYVDGVKKWSELKLTCFGLVENENLETLDVSEYYESNLLPKEKEGQLVSGNHWSTGFSYHSYYHKLHVVHTTCGKVFKWEDKFLPSEK